MQFPEKGEGMPPIHIDKAYTTIKKNPKITYFSYNSNDFGDTIYFLNSISCKYRMPQILYINEL